MHGRLYTEVHTDLVHPCIDVGVDLDVPYTRLARERDAETLYHQTSCDPDSAVIPVENDRARPGELAEAGQQTVGQSELAGQQLATLPAQRLQQGQQQGQQGALAGGHRALDHVAHLVRQGWGS